jgi:hypothetical protein
MRQPRWVGMAAINGRRPVTERPRGIRLPSRGRKGALQVTATPRVGLRTTVDGRAQAVEALWGFEPTLCREGS